MLISPPGPADFKQVSRWHEQQAKLKERRSAAKRIKPAVKADLQRDISRHYSLAATFLERANKETSK
jgi:hypothetical protein